MEKVARVPGGEKRRILSRLWLSWFFWPRIFEVILNLQRQPLKSTKTRGRHGGVEKRGGRKTSRTTPLPKRGFGPPLVRYVFHPPQVSVLCFPVQKSTTEQTRSSFGGVQKFSGERVLWYVFLPPYVLHPLISPPKKRQFHCLKTKN